MVRLRVIVALVLLLSTGRAMAQTQPGMAFTGLATAHIGWVAGGDVRNPGATPGVSVAVLEASGVGAEVDVAHARQFDRAFAESGLTTAMINVIGVWPAPRLLRPYVLAGAGALRVRACPAPCDVPISRTGLAVSAGGGALYFLHDALAIRGELRYLRYVERFDDIPLTDGGYFDFWRTSFGVTYSWPIR